METINSQYLRKRKSYKYEHKKSVKSKRNSSDQSKKKKKEGMQLQNVPQLGHINRQQLSQSTDSMNTYEDEDITELPSLRLMTSSKHILLSFPTYFLHSTYCQSYIKNK